MAAASARTGFTRVLSVIAVLAVVAAFGLALLQREDEQKTLTASFPRTVSLYEGSDVRILGVPVGKVETVTPTGTDVTVTMTYDAKYKVPADAEAVIITPAIVGDRFVQLTPVYRGGPALADGERLSTESTSTPLELDEIYQSIDDLMVALGPDGANSKGALTNLLDSTATNFAGQGEQFHRTIKDLGKFTGTLGEQQGGAVRHRARDAALRARAGRATTRRCATSTTPWSVPPTCSRTSGRTSPRRWRTWAWQCRRCPPS